MIVFLSRTIVLITKIIFLKLGVIMENKLADIRLQLEEIKSCLIVTQRATENENDDISYIDISNCLEVAIDLMNRTIRNIENI